MAKPSKVRPRILVIHGPNLNMLGMREPEVYGKQTLDQIDEALLQEGKRLDMEAVTFQSNSEGALVEEIQRATKHFDGLVINPGAYTHTSVAIRDALLLLEFPVVEVHLSNVYRRERFRHKSMIADIVAGRIMGFGAYGYILALKALAHILQESS